MARRAQKPTSDVNAPVGPCLECVSFGFPFEGVFVFGSNEAGYHGGGAAYHAHRVHGAEWNIGDGPTGNAYGIPTKDATIQTLPLNAIQTYVTKFLAYATAHPELSFNVTRIGCGLAGYTDDQIAPLFAGAPANCRFAPEWQDFRSPHWSDVNIKGEMFTDTDLKNAGQDWTSESPEEDVPEDGVVANPEDEPESND